MQFCDALEIGQPKRTKDGYVAVRARSARTGVYQYAGREVDPTNAHGLRDQASVNVLRDDKTVFDKAAAGSFVGKPITVDHPGVAVTSANWKDHARGAVMGALRDGEYLAFDLLLMDASAIADMEAGKKELSNGYAAELEFGDFAAADGTKCPVRQARITDGNHVALVDAGRAGPECRISDGGNHRFQTCDAWASIAALLKDQETKPMSQFLTLDGLKVDLSDADAVKAAVAKLQDQIGVAVKAKDAAETKVGELTAAADTKAGEIKALEAKLADATDPTKQAARDAARAQTIVGAQVLKPGITVDGKTDAAIRKEAVEAKLGDGAKDMSDAAVDGAFAALTKDVKAQANDVRPIHQPTVVADNRAVRDAARALQYS